MNIRIIAFILPLLPVVDCCSQQPFRRNFGTVLNAYPSEVHETPDGGLVILGSSK
jgi:hypothetical protein